MSIPPPMLFWLALLYSYQHTINAAPTPIGPAVHPILSHISSPSSGNTSNGCPNLRSTWDIVWNCLATIFACAWVSVHPNIPPPGTKEWQVAIMRSELMIWTIIAPEMMLFWAIRQWVGARKLAALYKDTNTEWSKTHGYFLQMGGFMLFDKEGSRKIGVLSPERLAALSADRLIEFPTITEEEIDDRSKGDALSKTLVLGQTSWFIAQCITRKAEGLVMTELELVTLAFAALNSFMYFFWWNKPLDVRTTVPVYRLATPLPEKGTESEDTIRASESPLPQTKDSDPEEQRPERSWEFHRYLARLLACLILNVFIKWPYYTIVAIFSRLGDMAEFAGRSSDIDEDADHVHPFYAMNTTDKDSNHILGVVAIIGTIFGAIHSAGWNFLFPTAVEAIIWKICSLIVTGVPFLMLIPVACQAIYFPDDTFCLEMFVEDVKNTLTRLEIFIGLPLYIIARIVLLTEALIALRHLPSGALLEVQWTSFLPHI